MARLGLAAVAAVAGRSTIQFSKPASAGRPIRNTSAATELGYKMVKWLERIEFVDSVEALGQGEGGSGEDGDNYDLLPNI